MEIKKIKENIDEAVKEFRTMLEKTYLDSKDPFFGINISGYDNFLVGKCNKTLLKNGNVRISGEMPSELYTKGLDSLPRKFEDYRILPLVVTLHHVPFVENTKEETKKDTED